MYELNVDKALEFLGTLKGNQKQIDNLRSFVEFYEVTWMEEEDLFFDPYEDQEDILSLLPMPQRKKLND